jgi:hypothetical protein
VSGSASAIEFGMLVGLTFLLKCCSISDFFLFWKYIQVLCWEPDSVMGSWVP